MARRDGSGERTTEVVRLGYRGIGAICCPLRLGSRQQTLGTSPTGEKSHEDTAPPWYSGRCLPAASFSRSTARRSADAPLRGVVQPLHPGCASSLHTSASDVERLSSLMRGLKRRMAAKTRSYKEAAVLSTSLPSVLGYCCPFAVLIEQARRVHDIFDSA